MNNKILIITPIILILIIVVIISLTVILQNDNKSREISDLKVLSKNSYETLDDDRISFDSFQESDKVIIINTWATWCPFCIEELPDFERLGDTYNNEVKIFAVNRKESKDKIKNYLREEVGFKLEDTSITFILDSKDNFYKDIGGITMPETLFFDSKGELVIHKRGFLSYEELESNFLEVRDD